MTRFDQSKIVGKKLLERFTQVMREEFGDTVDLDATIATVGALESLRRTLFADIQKALPTDELIDSYLNEEVSEGWW
jgi:hypothetical protein